MLKQARIELGLYTFKTSRKSSVAQCDGLSFHFKIGQTQESGGGELRFWKILAHLNVFCERCSCFKCLLIFSESFFFAVL